MTVRLSPPWAVVESMSPNRPSISSTPPEVARL
jgi:hypothetical protein